MRTRTGTAAPALILLVAAACGGSPGRAAGGGPAGAAAPPPDLGAQVLLGRQLVLRRDCGGCHGGGTNPASESWLAGGTPVEIAGYDVWPPNLTPDEETGIGRYTDRQLFNAIRYGLRPAVTPDVVVTSSTPGAGNHPVSPDYLSPGMPWTSWRHMADDEIWAIIAYLRHGLWPVRNDVPKSASPPDHWASWYSQELVGPHPLRDFPTANEQPAAGADRERVLRGRYLVASMGCSDCHGGRSNPAAGNWLSGSGSGDHEGPHALDFEEMLQVGPFPTYPRNLTPHNTTGLGRFTERQIFNALRYGLRPGETADVEITSTIPGEGNHPRHAKYLSPSMPWAAWRHLPDEDIRAIAAYLKHGLRPVENRVPDSHGPPDFWFDDVTAGNFGPYPPPPFPTARERAVR